MKTTDAVYQTIMGVVKANARVAKRENELLKKGFKVEERRCGSGGVGRIIEMKRETRVQIGYGHGKWNYASCVIVYKTD
jgi:hypothetical protein